MFINHLHVFFGEMSIRSSGGGMGWDGVGWEVGGRFKREGTYAYLWLIHVDVWQKPTQYCKAIILQLKIDFLKIVY